MTFLKSLLLAGGMLAASLGPAVARNHALLIGVADYTEESKIPDLKGPRNDVSLLWRVLQQRGTDAGDITVLAEGLPAGTEFPIPKSRPERAAILAEFERLAGVAQPGDTVFIYYSGHGTRQPDNPRFPEDEPETDGMDQVILPSDVGKFDAKTGSIKNSIIDDEIGRAITAIRSKGVLVWAVFDSCHSGTVTRGDQVTRSVDPALLGVPSVPPSAAIASRGGIREGTVKASKPKGGEGALVGFYAVESYDEAIERAFTGYQLPMWGEGDDQRMGVFTFLLHRALTRNTAGTFRELAQEIVSELNTDRTGGKVPPPVFDGDLDATVPGSDAARIPNSARGVVENGGIIFPVGNLQGFDDGAGLDLYDPAKPDAAIGNAVVVSSTAVTSTAGEIEWNDGATPIDKGTVSAVVADPAINFRFAVAPPPDTDSSSESEWSVLRSALGTAFDQSGETLGISLAEAADPDADVRLRLKNGRVWILRADRPWVEAAGAFDETPSLPLDLPPEELAAQLKGAVWSLARAAKLLRVTAALGESAGADDGIVINASLSKLPGQDPKAPCKGREAPEGALASPIDPLLPVAAGNCDFLSVEVTNDGEIDYWVAGFYVDALGGVSVFPRSSAERGCSRSLPAGADRPLRFTVWIDTWDEDNNRPAPTGAENFVVLAVPKDQTRQPPRLCSLTQSGVEALQTKRATKAAPARKGKLDQLIGAMEGETTRGSSGAAEDGGPPMSGRLFVFDVKP